MQNILGTSLLYPLKEIAFLSLQYLSIKLIYSPFKKILFKSSAFSGSKNFGGITDLETLCSLKSDVKK